MKIIEELSEMISEEISDAEKYAEKALECKDKNRSLADLFFALSNEELSHMQRLHAETVKIIEAYRKSDGEPPAPMMAVYEYLHKKHIEYTGKVKAMQAMYKETP